MRITENSNPIIEPYIPVADFYVGKSIFITGGTGFLGKVLTEKLLYSCPDIGNIYLLVRDKKNVSAQERAKGYFDTQLFDRLNKERPENLRKIKFISGDLTQANLGLSSKTLKTLLEEISVVFHLAATIKFNEPLSIAMKINVEGTNEVLKLCQNMKRIQVFVYMSTIFSNTNHERTMIEEKLYPVPMPLDEVYSMIQDGDENDVFSPELLDGRPNTYTFTKALAEHIVATRRGSLPTIIIRPSIVTPAIEEPVKGWITNWMGSTPVLYLLGKGWCRCVTGRGENILEIIPIDYVVNLTVAATARYTRSDEIPIYHSCTSSSNPLTLKETGEFFTKECRRQGFHDLPLSGVLFTTSPLVLAIMRFIFEVVPAYIADFLLLIMRKPVRYVDLQKKVAIAASATEYFRTKIWLMKAKRTEALFNSLNSKDHSIFPFNPSSINWEQYMAIYLHGIRKFLLKEKNYE
ncbi:putative fatty acyl-CoA reductase CG5065 [Pararge aegeria]|uniref:putative fatty acyl-CoA reductase CG5065 n=1 Tax=Pararge aegeria TaxID=116150 RepID=UPI0019D0ECD7|nr:putative fatty acyl-CoA reductase CG5065 [Pararge aegeria]